MSIHTETSTTNATPVSTRHDQGIKLSLAVDDRDITDHLVITFAKNGTVPYQEMLEQGSTSHLLYELERHGQNVTEPFLMAIAGEDGSSRRIFVTPCPDDNFRDYAVWVGMVTETIVNLKSRNVALYPCVGAISNTNAVELTCQLVRSLIEANAADSVAFIVGRYDYTNLLNMALELKTELQTSDHSIQIIH
jgi:hypothetical protein